MIFIVGILIAICSVAIFMAGLLAFLRNREHPENIWFLLMTAALAVWVNINYIDSSARMSYSLGHMLIVVDFIAALTICWCLLQFAGNLALSSDRSQSWVKRIVSHKAVIVSSLVNISIAGLLMSDEVFKTSLRDGLIAVTPGSLFPVYVAAIAVYTVTATYILLSNYFRASQAYKRKLSLIIVGITVTIAANALTNLVFPNFIDNRAVVQNLNSLGYLALFFLVFCVYIAITTRKLFDIKLVLVRAVVYITLVAVVGTFYAATITLLSFVLSGDRQVELTTVAINLAVTLFVAATFQYVRRYIDRTTNRLFFQDSYEPQEVLDNLTKVTASSVDINKILDHSQQLLAHTMKPAYCSLVVMGRDQGVTHVRGDVPAGENGLKMLQSLIPHGHKPIIAELLPEHSKEAVAMKAVGVELVFPLYTTDGVFGVLALGMKQNGTSYVQADIKLLTIATSSISVALQNALRFEEIERFNETLQQKVQDATLQLRESNKKLKQLNESKDDFIGMASHQLRTPLTSIKGYISLVMDGDAGRINANQKHLLQQAFFSSQRMVFLVADLLNVSRLKTGKFVIERSPINLDRLISDEMAQLKVEAANHGLDLTYQSPKHFPSLPLDETKTRQVIMNFLDNAIYYTPSGGHIHVELRDLPKSIEFRVIDDGIGVPKAERHHLFSKFYRAKNAQRARPDGTGLGLYMAQKIITAQGGAIIFTSEEGKGSTFGFIFPKDLSSEPVALPIQTHD